MADAELILSLVLKDFPSGSGISFYRDLLYIVGDDATSILVLDKEYKQIDKVTVFDYPGLRIPKPEKVDFETCTVVTGLQDDYLCIVGSASKKKRAKIFLMSLRNSGTKELSSYDYYSFTERLESTGLQTINIEGSTQILRHMVLANRGNLSHRQNHIIVTDIDFWKHPKNANFLVAKLLLPPEVEDPLGVSELCYVSSLDLLLVILTQEETENSYDDGAIGDSYIGWVRLASTKVGVDADIVIDGVSNLSAISEEFNQQKIEGLCVESVDGMDVKLHMTADNDAGETKLFKVRWTMPL